MNDIRQATDEQLLDSFAATHPIRRKSKTYAAVRREILRRMESNKQQSRTIEPGHTAPIF